MRVIVPLIPFLRRRRRRVPIQTPPPVLPLTLVSASYDSVGLTLTLVFDRAIDIGGVYGYAIVVDDAEQTFWWYEATEGAVLLDPVTVELTLIGIGDATGSGVALNVTTDNGIVAVDDGGAWAGVSNVELPFP